MCAKHDTQEGKLRDNMMCVLLIILVGLVTAIIGVIVGYRITKSEYDELKASVDYWRTQLQKSNRDANRIADEYEDMKKRWQKAVELLPKKY